MDLKRCDWCGEDPLYTKYHDEEWGTPVHEDTKLFEFLILEGAQAGLSWITVLRKRENYRIAFDNFDFKKVANYDQKKIDELLANPGIIRNKLKINSAIVNAQKFIEVRKEFGSFDKYIWQFVDPSGEGKPIINNWKTLSQIPAKTEISDQISKDLLKRGFKFVGSTICYAYMQACGLVNDHLSYCYKKRG